MRILLLITLVLFPVAFLCCSEDKESKPTITETDVQYVTQADIENVYNSCHTGGSCIYKECVKVFPEKESFDNCVSKTLEYIKTKKSETQTDSKAVRKSSSDTLDDKLELYKDKQPERKKFIEKMLAEKYIQKIVMPGKFPHVWIYRKFYSLTYDEKQLFGQIIWAYYITKDREAKILVFKDAYSGKRIGTYHEYGLDLK